MEIRTVDCYSIKKLVVRDENGSVYLYHLSILDGVIILDLQFDIDLK